MNITVTGGGGTIGKATVDRLVRSGHRVWSITQDSAPGDEEWSPPTTKLRADAADPDVLGAVFAHGMDCVVHLAAIPGPGSWTARHLLIANSVTTMAVLETAAAHGIRHVVLASSVSALGMAWSDEFMHPLYVPVDEDHPLRPTEGYGLSKENDEAAARMAARRWGMTVVCLRFPLTQTEAALESRARDLVADPEGPDAERAARELWAYLDVRDAAQAVERSLTAAVTGGVRGAVVLNVNSEDVLTGEPLEALLARWHPDVPIVGPLSLGAYPTTRARELIGFRPEHRLSRIARHGAM